MGRVNDDGDVLGVYRKNGEVKIYAIQFNDIVGNEDRIPSPFSAEDLAP